MSDRISADLLGDLEPLVLVEEFEGEMESQPEHMRKGIYRKALRAGTIIEQYVRFHARTSTPGGGIVEWHAIGIPTTQERFLALPPHRKIRRAWHVRLVIPIYRDNMKEDDIIGFFEIVFNGWAFIARKWMYEAFVPQREECGPTADLTFDTSPGNT